jgi:hypothetical protein
MWVRLASCCTFIFRYLRRMRSTLARWRQHRSVWEFENATALPLKVGAIDLLAFLVWVSGQAAYSLHPW